MLVGVDAKAFCPKCKKILDIIEFGKNKARKTNRNTYCRSCRSEIYIEKSKVNRRCEKHGLNRSSTYQTWADMKTRCNNPNHKSYPHYGGRGISYDPAWEYFSKFFQDMGYKPEKLTLERLDNEKGYSKENCIWADRTTQNRNKRGCKRYWSGRKEVSFVSRS